MLEPVPYGLPPVPQYGGLNDERRCDAVGVAVPDSQGADAAPFMQPCFDDVRAAIAGSNWRNAASYARALKCMAADLDVQPICDAASQVERLCKEGGRAELGEAMASLAREMARFMPLLLGALRGDPESHRQDLPQERCRAGWHVGPHSLENKINKDRDELALDRKE